MADPNKIGFKKTNTTYWESVMPSVGHPKYADSSIFEEGPEFAEIDAANSAGATTRFNKAVAVEFDKVFLPHLNTLDTEGDTIAAQITNVLKTRVGRNRTYTAAQVAEYLAVAGSKYAVMQGLKNAIKVATMVPRVAALAGNFAAWRDRYDQFMNSVNQNYPVPEDLASFIDEYVVGIYEDREDFFNKGLVVYTKVLEVYDRVSKASVEIGFMVSDAQEVTDFMTYMAKAPLDSEIAIARDINSFVKTKQLTPLSNVHIYPLDAKHRATLVNTAKFDNVQFDVGGVTNGDDLTGQRPHIACAGGDSLRMVGDQKADNINYWDAMCRNTNLGFNDKSDYDDLRCVVAIDYVTFRTANGEDEETWDGRMVVKGVGSNTQLDELELMLNYIDIMGGITLSAATGDNPLPQIGVQIEPVGLKSYSISPSQLEAIKLIAYQEVFNLRDRKSVV